jgi:hypothetical protein
MVHWTQKSLQTDPDYKLQILLSLNLSKYYPLLRIPKVYYCRPSNLRTSYVRISEITEEICWFRNFRPQWEYVKLAVLNVN